MIQLLEMDLAKVSIPNTENIAVLAGTFDPPTVAHLALAGAALVHVSRIILAVPRYLPHGKKPVASLKQREEWLQKLAAAHEHFDAITSSGGLYGEIAEEVQLRFPSARIFLICGRDAAERIFTWQYDRPEYLECMMERFELLVAPRDGQFRPPERWRHRVISLDVESYDGCSATHVREAVWSGREWSHLVPSMIACDVPAIYGEVRKNQSVVAISRNVRNR